VHILKWLNLKGNLLWLATTQENRTLTVRNNASAWCIVKDEQVARSLSLHDVEGEILFLVALLPQR